MEADEDSQAFKTHTEIPSTHTHTQFERWVEKKYGALSILMQRI